MAAKIKSLQAWCKRQCEGYRDVEITNMTSSWKSGLAFCAIIHRYRPDLIDYDSLSRENVYENNKLAFDTAQDVLDIAALLDAEDMVAMKVPDKLCIVTYVSQYYNYFCNKDPVGGPGVQQCRTPAKRGPTASPPMSAPETKKITPTKPHGQPQKQTAAGNGENGIVTGPMPTAAQRRGTYGDTCHQCKQKVYLMERHIDGSRLYHRRCFRDTQKSVRSPTRPSQAPSVFLWPTDSAKTNNSPLTARKTATNQNTAESVRKSAVKDNVTKHNSPVSARRFTNGRNSPTSAKKSALKDIHLKKTETNMENKKKDSGVGLVKMLHGGPAPYKSSVDTNKTDNKTKSSMPYGAKATSSNVTKLSEQNSANKFAKKDDSNVKSGATSISQRASLFDTGPKPRFGVNVSSTGTKSTSSSHTSTAKSSDRFSSNLKSSSNAKPLSNPSVFSEPKKQFLPVGSGSRTNRPAPSKSFDTPFCIASDNPDAVNSASSSSKDNQNEGGTVKLGLLHSLANIRKRESTGGASDISSVSSTSSEPDSKTTTTNEKDSGSFLVYKSALSNSRTPLSEATGRSTGAMAPDVIGTVPTDRGGILRGMYTTEGLESSGADSSLQKSILKPKSPRQSFDATSMGGDSVGPKPILKSRLSDEHELGSGDEPPKPILKSRKSLEGTEHIAIPGTSPNPRSILKAASPPDLDHLLGQSPPRSILKPHDASPPRIGPGSRPSRSILKSKEMGEGEMEVDDEQHPRSILKHSHDFSSDEGLTSPTRSILKHGSEAKDSVTDPKSILRTADHSSMEWESTELHDNNMNNFKEQTSVRPSSGGEMTTPARPQIHIKAKSPAPSSAEKQLKTDASCPPSKSDNIVIQNERQQIKISGLDVNKRTDRSLSPRSMLRKTQTPTVPASSPQVSHTVWENPRGKPWEKPPQAEKSSGVPSVSSSVSAARQTVSETSKPGAPQNSVTVNNFSAFTIQDSMLLVDCPGVDKPTPAPRGKPGTPKPPGVASVDKNKSPQPKSTWMIEMEARKGIRQKEPKATRHAPAPPRPNFPPQGQSGQSPAKSTDSAKPKTTAASDAKSENKPAWQLEAERRSAARQGKYVDPEFKWKTQNTDGATNTGPTRKPSDRRSADILSSSNKTVNSENQKQLRHSVGSSEFGKLHEELKPNVPPRPPPPSRPKEPVTTPGKIVHSYEEIKESSPPPVPSRESPNSLKARINRSPAFRINESPDSSPETTHKPPEPAPPSQRINPFNTDVAKNQRKILPDVGFSFTSGDFEAALDKNSPDSPNSPEYPGYDMLVSGDNNWIQQRPLPMVPTTYGGGPPKRQINAEARVATLKIIQDLSDLDKQLRHLEAEGRVMEEKIRTGSDDDMDEDGLMVEWFEMVNQKNELVRKESDLMYRQRQQELEDVHAELEHDLRVLMAKPDSEKTASDRVRENSLIQEIIDTVNLRNNIVDSMEEDRIRYLEEDREIADMMAKTGLTNEPPVQNKKKDKQKKPPKPAWISPDKKVKVTHNVKVTHKVTQNVKVTQERGGNQERNGFKKSIGSGGL